MEFKENTDFDLYRFSGYAKTFTSKQRKDFSKAKHLKNAGGSELNVVSKVAMLGIRSAIVTKLPENKMGHFIKNKIRYETSDDYILYIRPLTSKRGVCYYSLSAKIIGNL